MPIGSNLQILEIHSCGLLAGCTVVLVKMIEHASFFLGQSPRSEPGILIVLSCVASMFAAQNPNSYLLTEHIQQYQTVSSQLITSHLSPKKNYIPSPMDPPFSWPPGPAKPEAQHPRGHRRGQGRQGRRGGRGAGVGGEVPEPLRANARSGTGADEGPGRWVGCWWMSGKYGEY